MEIVGSLGLPAPRPQPFLATPLPAPRIAAGFLETVLIEVTRPVHEAFVVRVFDEDFSPADADLVAAFILYGADVSQIGRRLETMWKALGFSVIPGVRYACYRTYDHPRAFGAVLRSIEALQESFLP